MVKTVLLTGSPGCGKTTLIRRLIPRLNVPIGGFYTQEIRQGGKRGDRLGFEIVTLNGQRGVLAHVSIHSPQRIGKYGVDIQTLERLAITSIRDAVVHGKLAIIDEIGPMEMLSPSFCQAVLEAIKNTHVLGSITKRSTPFSDTVKAIPGVIVIEVHSQNRDSLLEYILGLMLDG